jgi:Spy/CpxP family protein refolding chaperone
MKKIVLAVLALFVLIGNISAQENQLQGRKKKSPVERAEAFSKKMTKNLDLDATQQERVKVINLDRFKQLEEARSSFGGDRKQIASKVKEVNDAYFNNLKGILTPEQFSKFQEMKEEMKERAVKRKG